jgi:hypothetical protein
MAEEINFSLPLVFDYLLIDFYWEDFRQSTRQKEEKKNPSTSSQLL